MHCSFNDGRGIVELMKGDALPSCFWENALLESIFWGIILILRIKLYIVEDSRSIPEKINLRISH
jgi:hypothetical protein